MKERPSWQRYVQQGTDEVRRRIDELNVPGRWDEFKTHAAEQEARVQAQASDVLQGRTGYGGVARPGWALLALGLLAGAAISVVLASWLFLRALPGMASGPLMWLIEVIGLQGWVDRLVEESAMGSADFQTTVDGAARSVEWGAAHTLATGTLLFAAPALLLYTVAIVGLFFRAPGSRLVTTALTLMGVIGAVLVTLAGSPAFLLPALLSVIAIVILWCKPCHAWYSDRRMTRRTGGTPGPATG